MIPTHTRVEKNGGAASPDATAAKPPEDHTMHNAGSMFAVSVEGFELVG